MFKYKQHVTGCVIKRKISRLDGIYVSIQVAKILLFMWLEKIMLAYWLAVTANTSLVLDIIQWAKQDLSFKKCQTECKIWSSCVISGSGMEILKLLFTYFTFFPAPSLIYNEWVCFIYERYKETLQSLEKACRLHTKKRLKLVFQFRLFIFWFPKKLCLLFKSFKISFKTFQNIIPKYHLTALSFPIQIEVSKTLFAAFLFSSLSWYIN